MVSMDSYGQNSHGTRFRDSISRYYRPKYTAIRKANRESYNLSNEFLRAIIDGVHSEFTTQEILHSTNSARRPMLAS